MDLNIAKEVAALRRMTVKELRARYAEVFGEPTNGHHKVWLTRRIAWRLQALAEGGLSERARKRAEELAHDADLRLTSPRSAEDSPTPESHNPTLRLQADSRLPPPGTVLSRSYKGQTLRVQVLPQGFQCQGQIYSSLSAVAKAVTGSHCNGFLFFRLTGKGVAS